MEAPEALARRDGRICARSECQPASGGPGNEALAFVLMAETFMSRRLWKKASGLFEQGATLYQSAGMPGKVASTLAADGFSLMLCGRLDRVAALYDESLAIARELGDAVFAVRTLQKIAILTGREGDFQGAVAAARLAAETLEKAGANEAASGARVTVVRLERAAANPWMPLHRAIRSAGVAAPGSLRRRQ